MKNTVVLIALSFMFTVVAKADETAPLQRPLDRPLSTNTKQLEDLERAVEPYITQAKATYPSARDRFLAGLPRGDIFSVTTRLHDSAGHIEQVFILVKTIADGRIHGRILSEIGLVNGFHRGDAYELPESEIVDWTISKSDGTEEGNYVGKFLDTYHSQ